MTTTRRNFLKTSGLAAAGAGLIAFPLKMPASVIGANKKVTCGLIGVRGMGFSNLQAFLRQPDTECVALCDVDRNQLERRVADTEKIQGKKPRAYTDFRKMLENRDIDVVIIATPDHWHCIPFVYAAQAGKDIYCEKPLANSIEEINIMVRAAERYNPVVQIGQWQRSDPHWQDAVNFVHSGKLGTIRTVRTWSYQGWMGSVPLQPDAPVPAGVDYDFWLGPSPARPFNPNRFHFTFRWFWDYAGGMMTDWGVHIIDYALYGMNARSPKSVMAMGGKFAYPDDACETPDTLQAIFEFDGYTMLWDHGIGIDGGYYGRTHGVGFVGNNGTLVVDRSGWEVIPEYKKNQPEMERVELQPSSGKGLDMHMRDFIACIKDRSLVPSANIGVGANVAQVALLGNIAFKTGRRLYWNASQTKFINDDEANSHLTPEYRAPWELPKIPV
jgi:predicted dehydrogenase